MASLFAQSEISLKTHVRPAASQDDPSTGVLLGHSAEQCAPAGQPPPPPGPSGAVTTELHDAATSAITPNPTIPASDRDVMLGVLLAHDGAPSRAFGGLRRSQQAGCP